ncbi:putative mediator of RNA polymerase II transcription subunit 26 isoform X2 [Anopheles merus]|uniref:putative mediator of RNA polymerase II transcription subunit 26 isoform X2 n=1 Tax=Anopheles merus TaxID=30066 RepID=UPI001BE45E3D|nr:putative mediator of RNA polymerase II transcription subunit 26 isoform X2 [Anopheles merus]
MMADTSTNNGGVAAGSPSVVGGGSGGALDPNVIPQWKKELIQRRKNLAKTIGAVATQVHDSASTVAAAISASGSSPVLAHPRTPTGGFPVGSPFYAGTKAAAAAAAAAVTSPTTAPGSFMGVHFAANEHLQQQHHQHQQQARGVGSSSVGVLRASEAVAVVVQPSSSASGSSPTSVPTANGAHSHSNAGSEHSGSSAAIATNRTGSSGTNSSVIAERESSSTVCSSGGPGTHTTSGIGSGSSSSSTSVKSLVSGANGSAQQQQQHGNAREGGVAARKMVAATAAEEIVVVYEKSSVLGGLADATGGGGGGIGGGGVGAGGITAIGDAGEELKYGPGIVSRLRCRYLSLALRQSVAKQRPSLNSMRRATSLNNLLDEESEDLSEREQSIGSEGTGQGGGPHQQQQQQQKKYQSQNYHYQHHQQQQQQHREQYANENGNNHNHNHQQQQLHPTVVLQPPYQKQPQHHFAPKQQPWIQQQQQLHKEEEGGGAVKVAPFLRGVQNSYTRASRQVEKKNEYNRYTKHHRGAGGADAVLLKRARSVEALVRYDHKAWERDGVSPVVGPAAAAAAVTTTAAAAAVAAAPTPAALAVSPTAEVGSNVIILDEIAQAPTTAQATVLPAGGGSEGHATTNGISSSVSPTATMLMNGGKGGAAGGGTAATPTELPLLVSDCVTIEEKIINGREKGDPKPKRLTSIIDADERPPPDVVKQTMKIFEANANRRGGRGVNGSTNGGSDVATKVASYRSIIISGSATAGATTAAAAVGPGEKPPITHPKPPLSPKKPNIMPRTASPKQQQQQQPHQVTAAKPPPTPKSLEAVNNLKNAPATAAPIVAVKNNNKAPIGGGGGGATSESTPPSPPARSKHTAAALNGVGIGVAVSKNMQSNGGDDDDGTQSADPTADAKTTNALKNGVGTVRDHHQHHDSNSSSSSNGTTQTAAAVTPSAKQSAPGSDGGNGGSGHQHKHNGNTALEAAAVPSAASSPTTGICDSPSIQQLTTKLGSLHLATSTPTGAANGSAVSVQDRRNLEYVTSDEEEDDDEDGEEGKGDNVDGENERGRRSNSSRSYQVNPESSESEDARDGAASGGSENDADDDEEAELDDDEERSVRKISRTAMENIARAGTTTQFRFNGAVKSYLPGGAMGKPAAPAPSTKAPAPPIPMSRESLAGKANGASTAAAVQAIEVSGRLPPEGAANNSVNGVGGGGSAKQHSSGSTGALLQQGGVGSVGSSTAPSPPSLTRREIEKNQINREKSGEPAVPAAAASSGTNSINGSVASGGGVQVASANNNNNNANNANSSGASGGGAKQTSAVDSTTSFVAKWGTGGVVGTGVAAVATAGQSSPLAGLVPVRKKTKPPPSHQQEGTNTMVFNFSDRKDVPDYIENDGVIIRPRPRELPKPGESGFVVLGDLTLETSTDPDDAWAAGPPSPCNGEFANAYIVINGKSSMRNKTSRSNNKFKIQFDDSLTSTYEYPSETSLLEETNGFDGVDNGTDTNGASAFADNGLLSHTNKLLSSVPLGSAPFASYTPVKAAIDTTFELGVTRTPSPSAASTASSTGSNGSLTSASNHSSNSHHSATSASSSGISEKQHLPHTVPNGHHHPVDRSNSNGLHSSNGHSGSPDGGATLLLNGATGAADGDALFNGATGEPESIQYLKPASDEQTVNWSQGTRVTDLLF